MEVLEQYAIPIVMGICFGLGFVLKHAITKLPNNWIPAILVHWRNRQFVARSVDIHAGDSDWWYRKRIIERRFVRDGKDTDRPGEEYI